LAWAAIIFSISSRLQDDAGICNGGNFLYVSSSFIQSNCPIGGIGDRGQVV